MRIQDEGESAGIHEELAAPVGIGTVARAKRLAPPAGEGGRVNSEVKEVESRGEDRQRRVAA
jgi:hypothetical protein